MSLLFILKILLLFIIVYACIKHLKTILMIELLDLLMRMFLSTSARSRGPITMSIVLIKGWKPLLTLHCQTSQEIILIGQLVSSE